MGTRPARIPELRNATCNNKEVIMKIKIAGCLILALIIGLFTGCMNIAMDFEFNADGSGGIEITMYTPTESLEEESIQEALANSGKEGHGTAKLEVIDGTEYLVQTESSPFTSLAEFEKEMNADKEEGEKPVSVFNKDGYAYVTITYLNSENTYDTESEEGTSEATVTSLEGAEVVDSMETSVLDPEGAEDMGEMLSSLVSYKVSVKAPLGVTVTGVPEEYMLTEADGTVTVMMVEALEANGGEDVVFTAKICEVKDVPFLDVPQNAWYRQFLIKAYGRGLIAGTAQNRFSPSSNLTHAQAMVMACAMNSIYTGDEIETGDYVGAWYAPYLLYAKDHGITDGRFDQVMNQPVTRGEMAFYFSRCLPQTTMPVLVADPEMSDIKGTAYEENIKTLAQSDIVGGYEDQTFRPLKLISRAEAAVILANMYDKATVDGTEVEVK